jgi:hypothetical protein
MNTDTPIVGTVVVTRQLARGVIARVDGRVRWFPSLPAVFRAAVALLDAAGGTTAAGETNPNEERKRP